MKLGLGLGLNRRRRVGGAPPPAFTPANLFAASEPGGWAPVEISRLWQDVSRTNPVTAVGQEVHSWQLTTASGVVYAEKGPGPGPIYQEASGASYLDGGQLIVSNFDLTGTDAVTVIVGIRKPDSIPGVRMIIEHSAAADANNGSFNFFTASNGFDVGSRGTTYRAASNQVGSPGPANYVVTMVADISNDSLLLRVDKTQTASSVLDQGTGNYTTRNLFIGARSGPILRLDGRIYGLIVRGAETTGTLLESAEDWMDGRINP